MSILVGEETVVLEKRHLSGRTIHPWFTSCGVWDGRLLKANSVNVLGTVDNQVSVISLYVPRICWHTPPTQLTIYIATIVYMHTAGFTAVERAGRTDKGLLEFRKVNCGSQNDTTDVRLQNGYSSQPLQIGYSRFMYRQETHRHKGCRLRGLCRCFSLNPDVESSWKKERPARNRGWDAASSLIKSQTSPQRAKCPFKPYILHVCFSYSQVSVPSVANLIKLVTISFCFHS